MTGNSMQVAREDRGFSYGLGSLDPIKIYLTVTLIYAVSLQMIVIILFQLIALVSGGSSAGKLHIVLM